jgi:hypothetical protein
VRFLSYGVAREGVHLADRLLEDLERANTLQCLLALRAGHEAIQQEP